MRKSPQKRAATPRQVGRSPRPVNAPAGPVNPAVAPSQPAAPSVDPALEATLDAAETLHGHAGTPWRVLFVRALGVLATGHPEALAAVRADLEADANERERP